MSNNKFIEVDSSGYGNEHTLEEIKLMCNDEENAIKTYLKNVTETVKYLNVIGISSDSLNVRTYFTTFYLKNGIDENGQIIGESRPLDDLVAVDFMVTDDVFESYDQADIYYSYIQPDLEKRHYVSFSKFSQMLKAIGVEFSFPDTNQMGKDAVNSDHSFYNTKIQLSQTKNINHK